MTNRTAPAPGTARHLAALPALLPLTPAQREALLDVAQVGAQIGMHAARRQVLESLGLVTSQRMGTGRGAYTQVTITDLGQDVAALIREDQRAQEIADEANEAHDAQVRAANRAARDADDHAAELDDEDASGETAEPMTWDRALSELGRHHDVLQRDKEALVRARIAELEGSLQASEDRAARWDAEAARAHERIAALERRLAETTRRLDQNGQAYREARSRITDLEDARGPARGRFHDLVAALQQQQPGPSFRVTGAVARLGQALGVPGPLGTQPPLRAEFAQAAAQRDGARPSLVLVDEVVPEVVGTPEPTTVREAVELDGHASGPVPALLAGDETEVREYVLEHHGARSGAAPQRVRVYGVLRRRSAGWEGSEVDPAGESLTVGHGSYGEFVVPLQLVLPYLAAIRADGFPSPARRVAILDAVTAHHPSSGG